MRYVNKVKKCFSYIKKRSAMKKYLERYVTLAQFLMNNGSDVDIRDMAKDLVYDEPNEVRRFIVDKLSRRNGYGFTAVMYASIKEDVDFLEMMLQRNLGSIDASDCCGYTALMYACRFNQGDGLVQVLLDNGADVNKVSNRGKAALDFARENRNSIIISRVGSAVLNSSGRMIVLKNVADTKRVRFNLDRGMCSE